MSNRINKKLELKHNIQLALPIVVSQALMMSMNIVDTIMVGRISSTAVAATGVASNIFWMVSMFGIGVLFSLDTYISQAIGANNEDEVNDVFWIGHSLCILLSLFLMPILYFVNYCYVNSGIEKSLSEYVFSFSNLMFWNIPFVLLYTIYQRYWQAREKVNVLLGALVIANIINFIFDFLLVEGRYGFPRMEVFGAALATTASRICLLLFVLVYSWRVKGGPVKFTKFKQSIERIKKAGIWSSHFKMLKVGVPAGTQLSLEVIAFSSSTVISTYLDAQQAAAHYITLTFASFTYMFPLGISAAASVRVGEAVGAKDYLLAKIRGNQCISMATIIMAILGLVLYIFAEPLFNLFSADPEVWKYGSVLMLYAAFFEIFDGAQVSSAGALRGFGETRIPMLANLIGYYPIGLTIGTYLCFKAGWNISGLWMGLSLGLGVVAIANVLTWRYISNHPRNFKPES